MTRFTISRFTIYDRFTDALTRFTDAQVGSLGKHGKGNVAGSKRHQCGSMKKPPAKDVFALQVCGNKMKATTNEVHGEHAMKKKLGGYLVVDAQICHGQPTFRGTRILVKDVLEQVAQGMAWKSIEAQWRGAVSQAAIAEAIRLANQAFLNQLPESAAEPACP